MTQPYASAAYARVFEDAARPLWVPAWGAHVLTRELPGGGGLDATGIYPLAPFAPEANLKAGIRWLKDQGLVSIALVPDPTTAPPLRDLQADFGLCIPFKSHLLVDYGREVRFSKHHRAEVKKALGKVSVEAVPLARHLEAWCALYDTLVDRHEIDGLSAFSQGAFERLAQLEGLTSVAAFVDGAVVSMHLWVTDSATRTAYSLLAASSPEGYRRSAAYAVYDYSIRLFSDLACLNLGGGAGLHAGEDGLSFFKRGFANNEVQAWFCGAILDEARYAALSGGATAAAAPFPAYRFAASSRHPVLRVLRPNDLPILHHWFQTPELWDHLVGDFTPRAEAEAIAYMQRWLAPSDTELRLGIEAQGRLLGLASLAPLDLGARRAELHVMIGEADERGRGVGRRAVSGLLERAWALGLDQVDLRVLDSNGPARRTYEACGFRTLGQDGSALLMQAVRPATSDRP